MDCIERIKENVTCLYIVALNSFQQSHMFAYMYVVYKRSILAKFSDF